MSHTVAGDADVMEMKSGGAVRIRVDLLRQWLRREKPVARAKGELAGEETA